MSKKKINLPLIFLILLLLETVLIIAYVLHSQQQQQQETSQESQTEITYEYWFREPEEISQNTTENSEKNDINFYDNYQ
ncbi:MAG: hypothetical protein E7496_05540 [Ruminococcus sp.]|nr:hypothetical protein [Ruminococcus sp.]